jgi:carboxyl-terminal processing protease
MTACVLPQVRGAASDPVRPNGVAQLRLEARRLEAVGEWAKAGERYAQLLNQDRNQPELKERHQYCLRRAQLVRRHGDSTYRDQLGNLSLEESLQAYGEVLTRLQTYYVEREKVEAATLFRQGLEELRFALDEEVFRRAHLAHARTETVRDFQSQLQSIWGKKSIRRLEEAKAQVRLLAQAAYETLALSPGAVVLEMAAGACAGLDEYTHFLTPAQFNELNASWKGEFVGIGIEVALVDDKLVVSQVLRGSSADLRGLKGGDRILRIGTTAAANLPAEAALELLKGQADTTIEVEILATGETRPRVLELKRQLVTLPSLSEPRFLDDQLGIGYLQLVTFQETTLAELDKAILNLQAAEMRALILDLRGNEGGLFEVAVQVVERFVSAGVIVSTHGQVREYNATYRAHGSSVLAVPLVVLVDGDTASSAEMVAGALKDHQRGTLVGRTTFGKGSIQRVGGLSAIPGGIRMTVAKFFSPRGLGYSDIGVSPHLVVEPSTLPMSLEQDAQVQRALDVARALAMSR